MTRADFDWLQSPQAEAFLAAHRHQPPEQAALAAHKAGFPPIAATQIKYWQRARHKLPPFAHAHCLLPALAYEQASSADTAAMKAGFLQANPAQARTQFADLTLGLGVDAHALAGIFQQGIGIEAQDTLADITAENFRRLRRHNLAIAHTQAETWLQAYDGPRLSLLFCDPARRAPQGTKVFLPDQCSPNVLTLWPQMCAKAETVFLKLSPMYDVAEARREFPGAQIAAVSVANECRELWVLHGQAWPGHALLAWPHGHAPFRFEGPQPPPAMARALPQVMLEPDAVFYKTRTTAALMQQHLAHIPGGWTSPDGFWASPAPLHAPAAFPGRAWAVRHAVPFGRAKTTLKTAGITRANILRRNFPLAPEAIARRLSLAQGGEWYLLCTRFRGEHWAFAAEAIFPPRPAPPPAP